MTVTSESFGRIYRIFDQSHAALNWHSIFVFPHWLSAWWESFSENSSLMMFSVTQGNRIIGIAPLQISQGCVRFIGASDVCDYMDFVIEPGMENRFLREAFGYISNLEADVLDLGPVRADSTVALFLPEIARNSGYRVSCIKDDPTYEMRLPTTWEGYLELLNSKQRHEVRRKIRRIHENKNVVFRVLSSPSDIESKMDTFFSLFLSNRPDKAKFMNPQMKMFFRKLAVQMAEKQHAKLSFLYIDNRPVATVICFDNGTKTYLYNNGYNSDYSRLSVGLVSKLMSIKDAIETGRKSYSFLKGAERYKAHMGGYPVPLMRYRISRD